MVHARRCNVITSAAGVALPEAIGAFMVSGWLIAIAGFSGWFERALNRIPISIASGMLASVLLRFGLELFIVMKAQFAMVFGMFAVYLLMRRLIPRYDGDLSFCARHSHCRSAGDTAHGYRAP